MAANPPNDSTKVARPSPQERRWMSPAPQPVVVLRVLSEGEKGRVMILWKPGVYTLGRAPDSTFVVLDVGVSRKHLTLELKDDRTLTVEDMGSKGGTRVNGREFIPSGRAVPIRIADHIGVGENLVLSVSLTSQEDAIYQEFWMNQGSRDPRTGMMTAPYFREAYERQLNFLSQYPTEFHGIVLVQLVRLHKPELDTEDSEPTTSEAKITQVAEAVRRWVRGYTLAGYLGNDLIALDLGQITLVGLKAASNRLYKHVPETALSGPKDPARFALHFAAILISGNAKRIDFESIMAYGRSIVSSIKDRHPTDSALVTSEYPTERA